MAKQAPRSRTPLEKARAAVKTAAAVKKAETKARADKVKGGVPGKLTRHEKQLIRHKVAAKVRR